MRPYGDVVHAALIYHLDLEPLTQRGEHLLEDDLLVPHRLCRALLGGRPALEPHREGEEEHEDEDGGDIRHV